LKAQSSVWLEIAADNIDELELKCTYEYTEELLAATKGVIEWLKNKLR
jgi:hypothetical protein